MPFDPNQPFELIDEEKASPPAFDPSKPWAEVPENDPWKGVTFSPGGNPSYTDKEGKQVILSSGGTRIYQTPEGQNVELPPMRSAAAPEIVDPMAETAVGIGRGGRFARAALADIGNTGPSNVKADLQGAQLPIDLQLQQVNSPKLSMAYKVTGGAIEMAPKMAALTAATVASGGLAGPAAAAMLFGYDDQGEFHPGQAAIAAALPGAGKLGGAVLEKVLGGLAVKLGAKLGVGEAAAQNLVNAGGRYATANAVLIAQALPGWGQMTDEQKQDAVAGILVNGVLGLADFGGYKNGEGKPDVQKAIKDFQAQAEKSAKMEELAAKSSGIDKQREQASIAARQAPGKAIAEPGMPLQAEIPPGFEPAAPAIPVRKAPGQRVAPAVAAQREVDAQRAQQMATEPSGLSMAVDKAKQAQWGDIPANEEMLGMLPQDRPSLQPATERIPTVAPEEKVRLATPSGQEDPLTPDKPLTPNQLQIMQDALRKAITNNQIPGERKGFIVGSGLEKWADGVLHDREWLKKANTVGLDMTVEAGKRVAALAVKGVALMEKGITNFAKWSEEMIKEHGDEIKPWLKKVYQQSVAVRAGEFSQPPEVSNAVEKGQIERGFQPEHIGTPPQRVQAEPGAGDSLQRGAEGQQAPPPGEPPVPARGGEVVQDIQKVSAMTPQEFGTDIPKRKGGLTGDAYRLGDSINTEAELAGLKAAQEQSKEEARNARASGDLNLGMAAVMKHHYFREAYERATGTGSAAFAQRDNPNYKPKFTEQGTLREKPSSDLPDWAREEMKSRGLNPKRTFNDQDLQNPSIVEGIKSDPTLTEEQKNSLLKKGSLPEPVGMGGAKYGEVAGEGNPDVYGVAARVREERAKAGQVDPVEPGQGIAPPDSVDRGRELLAKGTDPEKVMSDFEKTKRLSSEDMAVARAQGEKLFQKARKIEEKEGTDSPEWRQASKEASDWDARSKAMQTEWHATGQAQQGETDLDTGSFTGLQKQFKADTGKDFNEPQRRAGVKVAEKSKAATEQAKEAEGKLRTFLKNVEPAPEENTLWGKVKGVLTDQKKTQIVWKRIKDYIATGEDDYKTVVGKVATDLGLKFDEVANLMAKNQTTKRLADDVWAKQKTARDMKEMAKRWLRNQTIPGWQKALEWIPRAFFTAKTNFHGTVALGTHAPMVFYQPNYWADYVRNFGKMYKMVGSTAYHEMQMQSLLHDPNWVAARRGGLVNDPHTFEDFNNPEMAAQLGNLTGMGNRGYSVLKILRQDMFNSKWDKLPDTLKTPKMSEMISDSVNHVTGVVKTRPGKGWNVAFFAPRLEMSRAAWMVGDPMRALKTFGEWNKATPEEKYFATHQVREKATVAATMFGMLALNQGMLTAMGSKQKINGVPESMGGAGFDPMRSDFIKFKAMGMDVSYGNPYITMARLPVRLAVLREKGGTGKMAKLIYPDETMGHALLEYARTQESPFAAFLTDLATKGDYENRPLPKMPWSGPQLPMPKRLAARGAKPYTWPEFTLEQALPIPIEEALKDVWKNDFGMSKEQIKGYGDAFVKALIMAGTGARLADDWDQKKGLNW